MNSLENRGHLPSDKIKLGRGAASLYAEALSEEASTIYSH